MTRFLAAFAAACSITAAAAQDVLPGDAGRGAEIFGAHCILCHGQDARGCGPAAHLYQPRPANLTASTRTPEYKMRIIRTGGLAMGRSPMMPPWGDELDEQDIADVVAFLSTLERKPDRTC
jgi:mono/diheme cytochrome c family protein